MRASVWHSYAMAPLPPPSMIMVAAVMTMMTIRSEQSKVQQRREKRIERP